LESKFRIENNVEAGSWIPRKRANGHLPKNKFVYYLHKQQAPRENFDKDECCHTDTPLDNFSCTEESEILQFSIIYRKVFRHLIAIN
jgi:hypothetical protein